MSGHTAANRGAVIEQQLMLPWRRSVQMTVKSIFVRLGRSVITSAGIFLGTAFLASVLTQTAVMRGHLEPGTDVGTIGTRSIWLVVMSLLVATVGIVNSMLMAVTERYKEIGTMKCLGALDSFVVRLFLLESGMLGTLGAVMGALVGFAGSALVAMANHGAGAMSKLGPALVLFRHPIPLWGGIVGAVVLGGVLAVLAAMYPAWRAAKMPPAAALRVEI